MRYLKSFKDKGYQSIDIPTILKTLQQKKNWDKLVLVQQQEVIRIMAFYTKHKMLTPERKDYLSRLYTNTILNVSVKSKVINQPQQQSHIGLIKLNNLQNEL